MLGCREWSGVSEGVVRMGLRCYSLWLSSEEGRVPFPPGLED